MARALALLVLVAAAGGAAASPPAAPSELIRSFFEELSAGAAPAVAGRVLHDPEHLANLYDGRGHRPLWTGGGPLAGQLPALVDAIDESTAHGLDARRYHRTILATHQREPGPFRTLAIELLASDAFLRQVHDRSSGAVSPRTLDPDWHLVTPEVDALAVLEEVAASGEPIGPVLRRFWPASDEYWSLVEQRRRILEQGATLQGAEVYPVSRLDTLDANLERWRWLPTALPGTYVRVNIANFSLRVIKGGRDVLDMDVIVGLPYRRTPVFAETIRYLVFNPYWNVPRRLAIQDKLPGLKADPTALQALGYEARRQGQDDFVPVTTIDWQNADRDNFPYLLRQRPGPANALGRVKFMLPNPFDVYLHDTPSRDLFEHAERNFSAGCVRLSRALDLARWILDNDGQTELAERVTGIAASGETATAHLNTPLPTYFVYFTAFVDSSGGIVFRRDVYDRDAALIAALRQGPEEPGE